MFVYLIDYVPKNTMSFVDYSEEKCVGDDLAINYANVGMALSKFKINPGKITNIEIGELISGDYPNDLIYYFVETVSKKYFIASSVSLPWLEKKENELS